MKWPSRVFVLCSGRCGSMTFSRAAAHLTNWTAGHETRSGMIGEDRLDFGPRHVEVDNRLTWFLGRLHARFGNESLYVHLTRDRLATAESFRRRYDDGILAAYRHGILMGLPDEADPMAVCLDYVDTVTAGIGHFLADKPRMCVRLEQASVDFALFWRAIGGEGDLDAALAEWRIHHNASPLDGRTEP